MTVFGVSRSRVCKDHALIAPDSFVQSVLPGWHKTQGVVLIAPPLGAQFTQYLALVEPGGGAEAALAGVERLIYVLEGELGLKLGRGPEHTLSAGGYAFFPPNAPSQLRAKIPCRLTVFEKRYSPLPGTDVPRAIFGQEQDIEGVPFQGDPDAILKTLLPDETCFDLAVNVFTYRPGATLPQVEVHVMEHGLLMLAGQGVYRLGDAWYPVQQGDVIWMAPYCPQWFVAMGKNPARYLYYKNVNRDPLERPA